MTDTKETDTDTAEAVTRTENAVPAPMPTVVAEFRVDPHPDPVVQALVLEVEKLRRENVDLRQQLTAFQESLGLDGIDAR